MQPIQPMQTPQAPQAPQAPQGQQASQMTPEMMQALQRMKLDDPERYAQIMQGMYADYEGQSDVLGNQMQRAEALRGTATPEGRTTRNNIYTAANPLEHIAAGYSRYKGNKDVKDIEGRMGDMSKMKSGALRGMASGLIDYFK